MNRKRKWILRIALALAVLFSALFAAAIVFPQKFLCVDSGPVKADAIVVLGGGSHERPGRAAELFKNGDASRIIVSGAGDDEINQRILIENGIPRNVIQVEPNSRTTKENAQFTIALLRQQKIRSAILVTSWYHSRRTLDCFRHYAPEIKFYSRPSYFAFKRSEWTRLLTKRIYLEYAKLGGYWIRYGVCPF
ncbi:MAG TPA: YdcF family protein [Methylomirabilota bacterium]|nr:YdcF family protein [Methylomirabilota bacterium]